MSRRAFLLSAAGAAIILAAPSASSQRIRIRPRPGGKTGGATVPATPKSPATGPRPGGMTGGATGRVLNRAQLQQCVSTDKSLTARSSELDRLELDLNAKGSRIDRLGTEIDRKRPSIDLSRGDQVDAFNLLVAEHGRQIEDYNSRLNSLEALFARYNSDIASYNAQCADAEYYESDMLAIRGSQ
jgi:hypothetical protein